MELDYYSEDQIDGAGPIVFVATEGWVDLVAKGHAWADYVPFRHTDSVVYVTDYEYGDIVAFIVYRIESPHKASIQIGYTQPHARRKGVYGRLLVYFEEVLRDKGIRVYETIVSDTNKAMRSINDTREPVGVLSRKVIG